METILSNQNNKLGHVLLIESKAITAVDRILPHRNFASQYSNNPFYHVF